MLRRAFVAVLAVAIASVAVWAHAGLFLGRVRGTSSTSAPIITFSAPTASYVYPSAPATPLTTVTATVSSGSFSSGGFFTSSNCGASNISVATGGSVTVAGPGNLTLSQSCLITANYPGATPVTQTFTLTGTQQSIASISPCTLSGGCSYSFTVPASGLVLGPVPGVSMDGGIDFATGGGTIALGSGSQCSAFSISAGNLLITDPGPAPVTDACSYVITDPNAQNSPQTVNITASSVLVITFNAPSASYIYPSASGTLLTTVTATVTAGSFLGGGGFFTSSNCAASGISVATTGAVTVSGPSNLTNSQSCLITANYPGAPSVTRTFTLTGTQQTIASITPCSLAGGCNYLFVNPASGLVLGSVPAVTMSGGISFSAGSGTIALGVGLQCSAFSTSAGNLLITEPNAVTDACTYVITDANASNSPQTVNISATGSPSTGIVLTKTIKNIASATTPTVAGTTTIPTQFGIAFPPSGANQVPPGNIVVPSVGGVTLTDANVDYQQCSFWADGSLRFCPFSGFVPQLTGNATEQVVFNSVPGTFPTTSSIVPSSISSVTQVKEVLSNVNSSFIVQGPSHYDVMWGAEPGFYVTGGSVTGGVMRNPPQGGGFLGVYNCSTGGYYCVTSANYQTSTNATIPSGSTALTFASVQTAARAGTNANQVGIYDLTNPSAIPDNTYVVSALTSAPFTVTLSAHTAADIPATDVLEYGYVVLGGTSNALFNVSLNGSSVPVGVNIVKPGAGFSLIGSGAMTFDIDTLLNEYGSVDAPPCSAQIGAASFTGSYASSNVTATGVTGALAVGQVIKDSAGATAVVTGNPSGGVWTVNAPLTNGAMTANAPVCWYVSTPTKKGYEGFGPYIDNVSGNPATWERAHFTIEEWIGPTGPYMVKATITSDDMIWRVGQGVPIYSFDADMMNGSTEIIGAADGSADNVWAGISQKGYGSWTTLDPCATCVNGASGRPLWIPLTGGYNSSNSQALAQVIITPSAADAVFIHGDHSAPPLNNTVTPVPTVVTTSTSGWGNPGYANSYAPYEHGGTDGSVSFDSGGDTHFGLGPLGAIHAQWYLCLVHSCSDGGASWLQNMRVAADVIAGIAEGPRYDDTNLPINGYNVGVWTPPAAFTDPPVWNAGITNYWYLSSQPTSMYIGLPQPVYYGAVLANVSTETGYCQVDHYPELLRDDYLAEGERYVLDDWIAVAEMMECARTSYTINGVRHDGELLTAASHRQNSWVMNTIGPLPYLGPPNEPAIQYFKHMVADTYAQSYAWYSFVGSGNFWSPANGANSGTFTKHYDISANGEPSMQQESLPADGHKGVSQVQFMDDYWSMNTADMAMLDNCADANVCGFAHNFLDNYVVNNNAVNCIYNAIAYVVQWAYDSETQKPQAGWDATDPVIGGNPQHGMGPTLSGYSTVHTEAGSSIITAAMSTTSIGLLPKTTAAVSVGGTIIPLTTVSGGAGLSPIKAGWIIKDITNPTALTYPTWVTNVSGLNITISSPVTGPGVSSGDIIATSNQWEWDYPIGSGIRIPTNSRAKPANVDWAKESSPSAWTDGITTWPVPSTPQVDDTSGNFGYLCMDASGMPIAQYSTTPCASPTYVTWGQTGDWSMAYVVNTNICPAPGDWRSGGGSEAPEQWATANWRKALDGVMGTSADAPTAITNISPRISLQTTFGSRATWDGDDHF
jgi:hypothetical protein